MNKKTSGPMCTRCRNHGEPFVRLKGHRKICPWKSCECEMCILIAQRGGLNREKAKLMEEKIAVGKPRPGRSSVQKDKTKSKDERHDEKYDPGRSEIVGYKTKCKRKSKPKKLIPISPKPEYGYTITYQEPATNSRPVTQAVPFRTVQPAYQDAIIPQQFNIKNSPTSFVNPTRPSLVTGVPPPHPGLRDSVQDNRGCLTTMRNFPNPFYEDLQTCYNSPQPVAYDQEFEAGKLQELQVSPALCDHFNSGPVTIANGNATNADRLHALSRMYPCESQGIFPGENSGFYSRIPRFSVPQSASNVGIPSQTVHWTYTS